MPDAFEAAVRLLSARERTRKKLHAALLAKGFSAEEADGACERAQSLGYLSEARYAEVRGRALLSRGLAKDAAVQRLVGEGVPERAAKAAVAAQGAGDERARAEAALSKRGALPPAKAARFLLGRGFDEELVKTIVPAAFDDRGE